VLTKLLQTGNLFQLTVNWTNPYIVIDQTQLIGVIKHLIFISDLVSFIDMLLKIMLQGPTRWKHHGIDCDTRPLKSCQASAGLSKL